MGVRGKKLLAELLRVSNNNNNNNIVDDDLNDEPSSDHPFEVEFKRAPNGFMGEIPTRHNMVASRFDSTSTRINLVF